MSDRGRVSDARGATGARGAKSVFGFVARFAGFLVVFFGAYALCEGSRPVELHLAAIARAAQVILAPIDSVERVDSVLLGEGFSAEVGIGCDAAYPILAFAAGVSAFPAPLRAKVLGLLCGVAALEIANVIRVASLFVIGVRFPAYFHVFHTRIWEGSFVLLALVLWWVWALWILRRP